MASPKKVDQSGFQLDKAALLKSADLPMLAKPLVGGLVDFINALDVNHDGKSDLAQLAPVVVKVMPLVSAVLPYVDLDELVKWFIAHDFIKDKVQVEAHLKHALVLIKVAAEEAAKVKA